MTEQAWRKDNCTSSEYVSRSLIKGAITMSHIPFRVLVRGSGANTALRDASLLTRSLIAVANLGTPLEQALYDYESEMVRYGFDALRASLQGPDMPFMPRMRERPGDSEN
jgi:hypothetical protein